MLMREIKRVFKAGKFLPAVFCVSVQILKKFSILNIETKSIQKEIRKKNLERRKFGIMK